MLWCGMGVVYGTYLVKSGVYFNNTQQLGGSSLVSVGFPCCPILLEGLAKKYRSKKVRVAAIVCVIFCKFPTLYPGGILQD